MLRRSISERALTKIRNMAARRHTPIVDFVVAGAQKCGTSAMNAYLADHPQICTGDTKEVHFFDTDRHFAGLWPDYAHYHSYFGKPSRGQRIGEATPVYMYWETAPRRMWEYNPSLQLIVMLRNPADRAYSHWNMERSLGRESLSFEEAVHAELDRARAARPRQDKYYAYVDRGLYVAQLRRMWRFFPEEQTLVLRYDDFVARPNEVLGSVTEFLGVLPLAEVPDKRVYVGKYESRMTASEKKLLSDIYEPEVLALERLLGWDLNGWLQ